MNRVPKGYSVQEVGISAHCGRKSDQRPEPASLVATCAHAAGSAAPGMPMSGTRGNPPTLPRVSWAGTVIEPPWGGTMVVAASTRVGAVRGYA